MTPISSSPPRWDTASRGRPAGACAAEHHALRAHLSDCRAHRGRLSPLRSGALGLHHWLAPRVVTTALVLALLLGASWLMR